MLRSMYNFCLRLYLFMSRRLLGAFTDMIVLMHAILLWSYSRGFAEDVARRTQMNSKKMAIPQKQNCNRAALSQDNKWMEIKTQYGSLRQLSATVNTLLGINITLFLLEFIFYYSVVLDEVFIGQVDWRNILNIGLYLCDAGTIFVASAETCHQVNNCILNTAKLI